MYFIDMPDYIQLRLQTIIKITIHFLSIKIFENSIIFEGYEFKKKH